MNPIRRLQLQSALVIASLLAVAPGLVAAPATAVGISEDQDSFTLTNGIVTARVSKRSGDLTSLKYKELEMLDAHSAHASGLLVARCLPRASGRRESQLIPANNGGARGGSLHARHFRRQADGQRSRRQRDCRH